MSAPEIDSGICLPSSPRSAITRRSRNYAGEARMSAYDKDASMFTSRRRASGKTLKFSLSTGTKRAFSLWRCDSATGCRLRAALWVASKAAPQGIENGMVRHHVIVRADHRYGRYARPAGDDIMRRTIGRTRSP
jgi:hypothetical protein